MGIYDIDGVLLDSNSELLIAAKKLGLHLMPKTLGELNMVRRARQMTDIKWKPAATIKRRNVVEYDEELNWSQGWQDSFIAGTEYKGLPYSHGYYSGANRNFGMIGYQVSLDAFASSVSYANSYFCATDPWDASNGVYTPYGVTCDTLVCYAMGLSTWYGSDAGFQTLVNNGTIVLQFSGDNIADNIANVHIGDILWKKAVHVAIITDVLVDDNDNIYIEVSEATTKGSTKPDESGLQKGGEARRELWDLETFFTRFYGYNVYRYVNSANVTYTQSKFITLDGESPLHNLHDRMPLIPYMGDNFKYLSGHIPASTILIGTTAYAYLAVYKDGNAWKNLTVNNSASIDVEFSAAGNYEAFLYNSPDGSVANMTNRTVSCKWSVVS